jgi:hypothetical protein
MTLSVHRCAYIDHSLDPIDWDYPATMAGVEVTRWELWGSEALIALGAQMLPDLRTTNVYCPPDQLDDLEAISGWCLIISTSLQAQRATVRTIFGFGRPTS